MTKRNSSVVLVLSIVALIISGTGVVADLRQAPNSHVAVDLPQSFSPSTQFSGFVDETSGASLVILEFPPDKFAQIKAGFTTKNLATKGIVDVKASPLNRNDEHFYLTGKQEVQGVVFIKLILAISTLEHAALLTLNVPESALESGVLSREDLQNSLSKAQILKTALQAKALFDMTFVGEFKEAGRLAGQSILYNKAGKLPSQEEKEGTAFVVVAPSIDRQVVTDLAAFSLQAARNIAQLKNFVVTRQGTLDGFTPGAYFIEGAGEIKSGENVAIYQVTILLDGGGYIRFVAQAPNDEAEFLLPEFQKMANSIVILD